MKLVFSTAHVNFMSGYDAHDLPTTYFQNNFTSESVFSSPS